ncbi:ribosome silencing factor [Clostridiaceae bacterium NSJ-31]|uniref:Ribosomal silencing factor RsfS n=1 Tax=Ligaoa zhengdingensis TaxID=2763658 RepID=A0A926DVL0_9FIRM|nr:ribosome silencing factor [Ligaoa zhengdingensis]MBC8545521.1 ribosome silencing factor [Ligaoa zhengdingensis]
MTSLEMTKKIASVLDAKKAQDIKAIRIADVTSIADYFLIASANNTTLVKALADEVEDQMTKLGYEPKCVEGYVSASWIVLDYYDVIVHIFCGETRSFYSLERLWSDGQPVDLADVLTAD